MSPLAQPLTSLNHAYLQHTIKLNLIDYKFIAFIAHEIVTHLNINKIYYKNIQRIMPVTEIITVSRL